MNDYFYPLQFLISNRGGMALWNNERWPLEAIADENNQ